MQKAFSLQPDELRQAARLEEEQNNLFAQYGRIELQRRNIRKRLLPQIEERQLGLVRSAVQRLGISQFTAARIDQTNLVVEVPDQPEIQVEGQPVPRTNGAMAIAAKE